MSKRVTRGRSAALRWKSRPGGGDGSSTSSSARGGEAGGRGGGDALTNKELVALAAGEWDFLSTDLDERTEQYAEYLMLKAGIEWWGRPPPENYTMPEVIEQVTPDAALQERAKGVPQKPVPADPFELLQSENSEAREPADVLAIDLETPTVLLRWT